MRPEDVCKKCEKENFSPNGKAKLFGFIPFHCADCREHSWNYAGGQSILCHACATKMGVCVFCGKEIS